MRMEVREQNKIVELWLTREEKEDAAFRESLKPLYQQYKAQNYLVAVFLSGEADLYQRTIWWRSSCPERQTCTSRPGICCSTTGGDRRRRKCWRKSRRSR